MTESDIQNSIRIALTQAGHTNFRVNVGKVKMADGRWFDTGLPKGHSDLYGFRQDGQVFYIEVKTATGRASVDQLRFMEAMKSKGALAGIARSPEEALAIAKGGKPWQQDH